MKKIILTFIVAALSLATSHAQTIGLADSTLLVLFPAGTLPAYIETIRATYKATPIKYLPNTGVRIWKLDTFPVTINGLVILNPTGAADHIKSNTEVSSDRNYKMVALPVRSIQDTAHYPKPHDAIARSVNKVPSMICPMGKKKIIVAIADCGIGGSYTNDIFNPHSIYGSLFTGKIWKNTDTYDIANVDNDNNGYPNDYAGWNWANGNNSNIDSNDHGSHVSGIVAQVLNRTMGFPILDPTIITNPNLNSTASARNSSNLAIRGVVDVSAETDIIVNTNLIAQNVRIMSLKTQDANGKGTLRSLIEAIDYAMGKNANIMNLSLSYKGKRVECEKSILKKVIDTAGIRKKMLFVVAAGNNNFNLDSGSDSTYFPAYFNGVNRATGGNSVNMIVVGADSSVVGQKASFSNYGTVSVDIAASGTGVYSTFKDGWGWMSGTSMATPYVTATAALLGTQQVTWNYAAIKMAILNPPTLAPIANGWSGFSRTGKILNIEETLGCYENDIKVLRSKSNNTQTDWAELAAIPNPFSDFLQIQINSQQATEGELFIQNALGQVVYHQKVLCQQGQNVVEWQSSDVVKGIYIVKVLLPNRTLTQKILKQ